MGTDFHLKSTFQVEHTSTLGFLRDAMSLYKGINPLLALSFKAILYDDIVSVQGTQYKRNNNSRVINAKIFQFCFKDINSGFMTQIRYR